MRRLQILSEDSFVYQPGNCTRYRIYARVASGGRDVAFMWLDRGDVGGSGMLVNRHARMDLGYFMEKTGIRNEPDAVALLCFLREQFGVSPTGIPISYRTEKWFQLAETDVHEA